MENMDWVITKFHFYYYASVAKWGKSINNKVNFKNVGFIKKTHFIVKMTWYKIYIGMNLDPALVEKPDPDPSEKRPVVLSTKGFFSITLLHISVKNRFLHYAI
jgi:hypothetical protein